MLRKKTSRRAPVLRPRLRVLCGSKTALGPGRVDLLEFIDKTGSLRSAATRMDMSYMRAWTMVKSVNDSFRTPLVEIARGGKRGGGARLTVAGRTVVGLYRRMEKESQGATSESWKILRKLLQVNPGG